MNIINGLNMHMHSDTHLPNHSVYQPLSQGYNIVAETPAICSMHKTLGLFRLQPDYYNMNYV